MWEGEGKGRKGRGRAIPPNENPGYGLRHVSIGYCKYNQSILLKFEVMIGPTGWKNCLTFSGDPVPVPTDSDRFSTSLAIAEHL